MNSNHAGTTARKKTASAPAVRHTGKTPPTRAAKAPKKELPDVISEWVSENRKTFWKYDVSCFHKTYKISIDHLTDPADGDLAILPYASIPGGARTKLIKAVKKASSGLQCSSIALKIDYVDGAVVAAVL